jgi:hypothetical protein
MPTAVKIRSYDQLVGAFAARRRQLGLRQLDLDQASSLQSGYCGKIESQTRRLGPLSLPMILAALDCDLLLCPRSPTVSPVERTGSCRVVHHATTEGN